MTGLHGPPGPLGPMVSIYFTASVKEYLCDESFFLRDLPDLVESEVEKVHPVHLDFEELMVLPVLLVNL